MRLGSRQTDDEHAVPCAHASIADGTVECVAYVLKQSSSIGSNMHDGRNRTSTFANRRPCQVLCDIAIEANILGEHQAPVAANTPPIMKQATRHDFAARGTPEHDALLDGECCGSRHVHIKATRQPGSIEQNRFLGEPGEICVRREFERCRDRGQLAVTAVYLLG